MTFTAVKYELICLAVEDTNPIDKIALNKNKKISETKTAQRANCNLAVQS